MARRAFWAAVLPVLLVAACTTEPEPAAVPPGPAALGAAYFAGRSGPVTDPVYPQRGNAAIDVLHYGLDLDWAPTTKTLTGRAELVIRAAKPVTEIRLDFAKGYKVREATLDGTAVTATRDGEKLVLPAPKPIPAERDVRVVVRYDGVPKQIPMPSTRADAKEGLGLRPTADGSAWTMQEPFGALTWYPCNDHPSDEALYEIRLKTAPGWAGVASGTHAGVEDGRSVFRSTVPVASYVTTLAFGKYTQTKLTGPHGIPISLWTRKEDAAIMPALKKTPKYLEFLEKRYGPYPLTSAGAVVVPADSAMETQELITLGALGAGLPAAERNAFVEEVMVHELAHQWFGDAVTPLDWRGVWLNEGWATFTDGLYGIQAGTFTAAEWVDRMRGVDARTRARSGPPGKYDPKTFADGNVYVGPALMLREIQGKVGDTKFFAMARDWVQTQRHSHQDRASFTAFVNRHTGQNLTPIIDKWLDSPTTPK